METLLRIKDVPGTIVLALPLGWSVGEVLNSLGLWFVFEKDFKNFSRPVLKTLIQVLLSSISIGVVSYFSLNIFASIFNQNTTLGIFMQGFVAGILGIIVGIVVLVLLKNKEIVDVWQTLKSKIFKAKDVIPAEPTGL